MASVSLGLCEVVLRDISDEVSDDDTLGARVAILGASIVEIGEENIRRADELDVTQVGAVGEARWTYSLRRTMTIGSALKPASNSTPPDRPTPL